MNLNIFKYIEPKTLLIWYLVYLDPLPIIVKPIRLKYYLVVFSIDILIAGTVCHRLFVMLNHCQPLNLLYVTLISLTF